jgi:murein DD-endopeptidase MepM/ murein hydrolase activator NlpD
MLSCGVQPYDYPTISGEIMDILISGPDVGVDESSFPIFTGVDSAGVIDFSLLLSYNLAGFYTRPDALKRSGLGEPMEENTDPLPKDAAATDAAIVPDAVDEPAPPIWEGSQWLIARFVAWGATASWRMTTEWHAVRPALMRYTGHVAILLLAIAALFFANFQFPYHVASAESPSTVVEENVDASSQVVAVRQARLAQATPTVSFSFTPPDDGTITRLAVPHTTIPERPRSSVFTYTVESGDTVFGIAEMFGLTPYTIYWANSETLEDNPHRLAVGMVLNILPVDGVYHAVSAGETVAGLAEEYDVEPEALYNEWNVLQEGQPLTAGLKLVIPGGTRDFIAWQLPKTVASDGGAAINRGRPGMCGGNYVGLPGRGWFNWPTGGRRISGWYFRDGRNPAHGGLDIGLRTGEAIYAADGGVVVFAGWWGGGGYGNMIVVDHLNGWQTWYAHLSQVNVFCGQQVGAGEVIGLGGSTGWSSGPHLHFEVRLDGVPYDPLAYLP